MANAKSVAPVITNPLVLAALAGNTAKASTSLGERLLQAAIVTATDATVAAGQLTVAFDTVNFADGRKIEKLNAMDRRSKLWNNVAKRHNIDDASLAAYIAS
jgi:hypothetical protein